MEDVEKDKYAMQHVSIKIRTCKNTYKQSRREWLFMEGEAENENRRIGTGKKNE